jgi:hypothetical protein
MYLSILFSTAKIEGTGKNKAMKKVAFLGDGMRLLSQWVGWNTLTI